MIYLDNAATTLCKPPAVAEAVAFALASFGGAGRSSHLPALAAGRCMFEAREALAQLLDAPQGASVAFTLNATEALNIALQGLVRPGDVVLTTAASHNSMLRPLFRLRDEQQCRVIIIPIMPDGSLDMQAYERAFHAHNVALVAATHASNVTGDVYDVVRMAQVAHEHGAHFVLDAAQTAGSVPLSMKDIGADVVCFTGHKSLFGPQGTGGLCVVPSLAIAPLFEGGSGAHSFDERHPRFMPEALEAGTPNAHGIAGLLAGIHFLQEVGIPAVHDRVVSLANRFANAVCALPAVTVVGRLESQANCGIVALSVAGRDSALLADTLADTYEVCARAGAHCAPRMHEALQTQKTGLVRFSFSYFNTEDDADQAVAALEDALSEKKIFP